MEKKFYEEPEVTKVEFDFEDRITASECMGIMNDDTPAFCEEDRGDF